jgi:hypothetical protein
MKEQWQTAMNKITIENKLVKGKSLSSKVIKYNSPF